MPSFKPGKNALSQKRYRKFLNSEVFKQMAAEMYAETQKRAPIKNPNILLKKIKKGKMFKRMKKEMLSEDFAEIEKILNGMQETDESKHIETMKRLSHQWLLCKYIYWLNFACTSEKWKMNETASVAFQEFKEKWLNLSLTDKFNKAKEMFEDKMTGLHYFRKQKVK